MSTRRRSIPRILATLLFVGVACTPEPEPTPVEVSTAMKHDLAFAFYPLSGASISGVKYRDRFPEFWARFGPGLPGELLPALEVMRSMRDEHGFLVGSSLARLFNRVDGVTIDAIADELEADTTRVLEEVDSWGPGLLEAYRFGGFKSGIVGVLRALEAAGFEQWWVDEVRPRLEEKADALRAAKLGELDVNGEVERWSGQAAKEGAIRLSPVYFMLFQGQQVLFDGVPGLTYLVDYTWSVDFVTLQLVHEVAHNQLLDWSDPAVVAASATLGEDPYFKQVFEGQKVTSGYVTVDAFVEENVTEAVQMRLAVALGIPVDEHAYLRDHERGTHVLGAAILQLIDEQAWVPGAGESFQSWFLRAVSDGALGVGDVRPLCERFFEAP